MKSIINGKVYYKGQFNSGMVVVYGETITEVLEADAYENYQLNNPGVEEIDARGAYVVPGFIDVHIHGYGGVDTMDGSTESIDTISRLIPENGVTAYLPTTMTMSKAEIEKALESVEASMNPESVEGAMVLGAHMEGPFINESFKGAQSAKHIVVPDKALLDRFIDTIKVITIAPEVDGALEMIEAYKERINFSLGHTGATYEQASEAYEKGAKSTTHLFNAMTGLHHRKPGVVGAAMNCDCYTEVIADNFHLNPVLFKLLAKVKGFEKILLITDCMQAGGLPEGNYELGGQAVKVENGQCRLESGTIAGSVLRLNEGLKNFTDAIEEELTDTLPLVTENQARYLGVEANMGTLDKGKLANIVIMDQSLNIKSTIVKGKMVYEG